jgi:hypothetical protein
MSTTPAPSKPTPPAELPPPDAPGKFVSFVKYVLFPHGKPGEIIIISHSHLFYWWPVWFTCFVLAILTAFDNHRMAIVPPRTVAAENRRVQVVPDSDDPRDIEKRDVLIVEKGRKLPKAKNADGNLVLLDPNRITMAQSKNYGIIFVVVLLLVIFITNVPLRGLWSVFIIVVILLLSIIFALSGVWDWLVTHSKVLAIHINLGGYFFIGTALLITWLINFFFFDRQFYMIFTPGQVRVHLEIGAGETCYDTSGMVFQKQRSDLFRHWILGFGSGDLVIRPAGGAAHIDLPNVLSVGRRVREIEKKLAEKEVVAA